MKPATNLLMLRNFQLLLWLLIALPIMGQQNISHPEAISQTTEKERVLRFDYGMNFGFYMANGATANYYNGTGQRSLEQVLSFSNNYNRIRNELGYDFSLHSLPMKMSYKPAVMLGFYGSINFNPRAGIMAEFNYARLKAEDRFSLEIERVVFIEGDNIELYPIYGTEERLDLRFSFQYTFLSKKSYLHPFFETGVSITDTKVKENRVRIHSQSFSLHIPQTGLIYERDYGIGFGGFATAGLKLDVNEQFALWLGYSANYSRINLGVNERFLLQHTLFLRLSLASLSGQQP